MVENLISCQDLCLTVANGRVSGDLLGNFTCFTPRGRSVVDLILADTAMFKNIKHLSVLPPEYTSVHSPISCVIHFPLEFHQEDAGKEVPLKPKLIWDANKIDILRNNLLSPSGEIILKSLTHSVTKTDSSAEDIDTSVHEFNNLIVGAAKICMKTASNRVKKKHKNSRKGFKWYSKECVSAKRRLQNLAKLILKNPKDPYLLGQYNVVKKQYRKIVKQAKHAYEVDTIKMLEEKASNPKDFWAFFKKLGKNDEKSASPSPEEWLEHFSSLNANDPSSNPRVAQFVSSLQIKLEQSPQGCDMLTARFQTDEVLKGIKSLKMGKAVAADLINNEILKATGDIIAPFLVALFNKILDLEKFPEDWSLGLILPLFKSGEIMDVNCYRGITINSCLSKLFMLLLNNRLQTLCDKHNIIHYNQIGFRKGFRPSDHVFTLKTMIDQSFRNKKSLHVCFVDFKKAYDTVWRDALYHKLLSNGIHPKFVRLLKNIYSTSSLAVKTAGGRSTIFPSKVGLKQGCNLSPLLFNLFVNDLLTEVNKSFPDSPQLNGMPINALMYADDLVLISETEEGLQGLLDILYQFTETWNLKVNKSKTKSMHFSRSKIAPEKLKFGSDVLESTESYCYLGTIFTKNGSLNEAGNALHDKAIKAMYGLIRKVNKHRSCTPGTMLHLFEKMVLPISLYNSEVWGTMCFPVNPKNNDFFDVSSRKNPVEDVQVKFCKRTLGIRDSSSNWASLAECGRLPSITLIIQRMVSYWYHASLSPSPIVRAALKVNASLTASGYRGWFSYVTRCLKFLGIEHIIYTSDITEIKYQVNRVKFLTNQLAERHWLNMHQNISSKGSKLDLFCSLKKSTGISPYLAAPITSKAKNSITKFRLSAHNLPVETQRYLDLERSQRLCPLCNSGVGNELHYFLECRYSDFAELRSNFSSSIKDLHPTNQDPSAWLISLLNSQNPKVLGKVGSFISTVMDYFKVLNTNIR